MVEKRSRIRLKGNTRFVRQVVRDMQEAGFMVDQETPGVSDDLLVSRVELGRLRCYVISCVSKTLSASDAKDALEHWNPSDRSDRIYRTAIDECWLVGTDVAPGTQTVFDKQGTVYRAFALQALLDTLRGERARTTNSRSGRKNITNAVRSNYAHFSILVASLGMLIEDKLESLRAERPNSRDSKRVIVDAIAQYEKLRRELVTLRDTSAIFIEGKGQEPALVKAVEAFADGVRSWWGKGQERICQSAFEMALFGTAVGICSIAGAGGKIAVAVSAGLVGGKKLTEALKGLKGLWK